MHTNKFENNFFDSQLTQATTRAGERYTGNEKFDELVSQWYKSGLKMRDFVIKKIEDIQPNEDNGIYTQEELISDTKYIKNFEQTNNFQETQININEAIAAEITFLEGVHKYAWLGDEITAGSTHRFDDYKNGIDAFIVHHNNAKKEDFVLGFDITTSQNKDIINNKIDKNLIKINQPINDVHDVHNALHQIKYFKNPVTKEKKQVYVPRIVLSMNITDVKDLMDQLISQNKNVAQDQIKINIKNQIIEQLSTYVGLIIQKNVDSNYDMTKNNWKDFLNHHMDEMSDKLGLLLALEKYITPLEYFEKL